VNESIVFISTSRIVEGDRAAFEGGLQAAARLIEATKPRSALFGAYVDEAGREVRIVHVFPDATAMTSHFEGSDDRTRSAARLIEPTSFEVYGRAPAAAIETLRREAGAAGGTVGLWLDPVAGFLRAPA
jgi:hypothetical protein